MHAHLARMAGDTAKAATLYREAAALSDNQVERRYLLGEADRLT